MRTAPPRRTIVRAIAGVLVFAANGWRRAAAEPLVSQKAVEYQETSKDLQMCGTCTLFVTPASCKAVEGPVVRQGWCKLYDPVD